VPRFLRDAYAVPTLAPLATRAGALWAALGDYAIALYPFVEARTATAAGLSDAQWGEFGAALRQVHSAALPPHLAALLRRETFVPEWAAVVARLDAHIGDRDFSNPDQQTLAVFWRTHRPTIQSLLARAESLGQRVQAAAPPLVLCHADLHTWNVLVDSDGHWWLVDWDEVVLAPQERDLMFVIGSIGANLVTPRQTELFLRGYRPAAIDPVALAFYRYAWAVGDIGAYGERVFLMPDTGPATRRAAVDSLMGLFAPGEIVSLAFASDVQSAATDLR
jgi:spectinomycin phosphotransferase